MIERNKYIYLRYKIKTMSNPSAPTAPKKPKEEDYQSVGPNGAYYIDYTRYTRDLKIYNESKSSFPDQSAQYDKDYPAPPSVQDTTENPFEALKLFATKIDYTLSIGTQSVYGLSQADLVHWYMKPVTIQINGTSIVSPNPLIDSDNIIISMVKKLQKYLSEESYNYFQKPLFVLYIENGVATMDNFIGVIKNFHFTESIDYPDKFDFDFSFEGKPGDMNLLDKATQGFASDVKETTKKSAQLLSTSSILNAVRKV